MTEPAQDARRYLEASRKAPVTFGPQKPSGAVGRLKRLALYPLRRYYVKLFHRTDLCLGWCAGRNWGDSLNPVLAQFLSGRRVRNCWPYYYDRYLAIGSVLGFADSRTEVWGSGFIREGETGAEAPKKVHAVRGPLSRMALLKQGIDCPDVLGDPALLLPYFYNPEVPKRFDVGIIPHFIDKGHPWIHAQLRDSAVHLIDVESDTWEFVRQVKSCRVILSSSLHGLICADAYGVPNVWIVLSDKVIGADFKFRDYKLSIGAGEPEPFFAPGAAQLGNLTDQAETNAIGLDQMKLLLACPFLCQSVRARLMLDSAPRELGT